MSSPVHLHVVIHGFPSAGVDPAQHFRGQDYPPLLALDYLHSAGALTEVVDAITWLGGNDAFAVEFEPRPVPDAAHEGVVWHDGTLTLAGEVNHGLARLRGPESGAHPNLLPALRAAGLAYFAGEHDGAFEAWRPGWDAPRQGMMLEGDVVLSEPDYHRLMREHATVGDGALAVARYFATAEEVAKAAREEVPADA